MNTQDSTLPPGSNRLSSALQWPTATVFIGLCLTARFVQAELPVARLLTLFPPGAQIGNTVEVSATGVDLDDASYLLFSSTNIVGRPLPSDANKFVITVASNTLPGVYDARFVGRFGISNPRAFVVGSLPEVIEKEGNNTMAKPMEIQLGAVVNGRAEASAVVFFKFSAKKGQRVMVECAAKSIDSRMDAALVLYDGSGRELERNRKGGLLDFSAAADGDYLLKVHDFLFRGGPEYFYRLSLHTGSHIDFVFPPAGQPGTKGKYILYGRNLGARPSPGAETGEHADTDSLHPLGSAATAGGEMKIDGKPL